jgi:hypothetical protein
VTSRTSDIKNNKVTAGTSRYRLDICLQVTTHQSHSSRGHTINKRFTILIIRMTALRITSIQIEVHSWFFSLLTPRGCTRTNGPISRRASLVVSIIVHCGRVDEILTLWSWRRDYCSWYYSSWWHCCLCYGTVDTESVVCLISARKLVVDSRYFDSVDQWIEERNIRVVLSIN